jgi:hypothetical protein
MQTLPHTKIVAQFSTFKIFNFMATSNSKSALKEQVNAAKQVENANVQVADSKSALAGEQEKVYKTLMSGLNKLYQSRTTINGRLIDLASIAGDYTDVVKSGDFKGAVKSYCDHVTVAQTDGKGGVIGTYIIPVKFVALASREKYTDYKISDFVETYMGRKSSKNWTLVSYTHDGETVACTDFAALRHDYSHEVTRMQSAEAADGTQVMVPVFEQDENGNRKVVKDVVTETFVPIICDTISPRKFQSAVKAAIEAMWLKLFK